MGNVQTFLLIEAARDKQGGVDMSSMRTFGVNLETKILFTIFCVYSTHWHHGQGNWLFLQILSCGSHTGHILVTILSLQWAIKLVFLTNIIDQKYPLQHSRNLYYRLQKIIHHV